MKHVCLFDSLFDCYYLFDPSVDIPVVVCTYDEDAVDQIMSLLNVIL